MHKLLKQLEFIITVMISVLNDVIEVNRLLDIWGISKYNFGCFDCH